jgi:hypothetical protein
MNVYNENGNLIASGHFTMDALDKLICVDGCLESDTYDNDHKVIDFNKKYPEYRGRVVMMSNIEYEMLIKRDKRRQTKKDGFMDKDKFAEMMGWE